MMVWQDYDSERPRPTPKHRGPNAWWSVTLYPLGVLAVNFFALISARLVLGDAAGVLLGVWVGGVLMVCFMPLLMEQVSPLRSVAREASLAVAALVTAGTPLLLLTHPGHDAPTLWSLRLFAGGALGIALVSALALAREFSADRTAPKPERPASSGWPV